MREAIFPPYMPGGEIAAKELDTTAVTKQDKGR